MIDLLKEAASAAGNVVSSLKKVESYLDKGVNTISGALPGCVPIPTAITNTYVYFMESYPDNTYYVGGHMLSERDNILSKLEDRNVLYMFFGLSDMSKFGIKSFASGYGYYEKYANLDISQAYSLIQDEKKECFIIPASVEYLKYRYECLGLSGGVFNTDDIKEIQGRCQVFSRDLRVGEFALEYQAVLDLATKFTNKCK